MLVVGALSGCLCFLAQFICVLSITWIKVKHLLDEKKRKSLNVSISRNEIEMRKRDRQHHTSRHGNLVRLNNSPYNKILVEVYLVGFIMLAIAIHLAGVAVKKNLNDGERVHNYSRKFLWLLDLAPRILSSIILPVVIHIRNPEIKKHFKGLFWS